jgi:hypothetical protein
MSEPTQQAETTTFFRPIGDNELALIREHDKRAFPAPVMTTYLSSCALLTQCPPDHQRLECT